MILKNYVIWNKAKFQTVMQLIEYILCKIIDSVLNKQI